MDPTPTPSPSTPPPTPEPTLTPGTMVTSTGVADPPPVVVNVTTPTAAWLTPVLVVSALALAFTMLSFWWIQVRRGRLVSFAPQTYAGALTGGVHLNIPLVLHNTGPAQMVVRDFRLRLAAPADGEQAGSVMVMSWSARQGQLEPAGRSRDGEREGTRSMPAPFTVDGRRVEVVFIEFAKDQPSLDVRAGPLDATVQVKLGRRAWWDRRRRPDDDEGWAPLLTFPLNTQLSRGDAGAYIARPNDPNWSA